MMSDCSHWCEHHFFIFYGVRSLGKGSWVEARIRERLFFHVSVVKMPLKLPNTFKILSWKSFFVKDPILLPRMIDVLIVRQANNFSDVCVGRPGQDMFVYFYCITFHMCL